MTGVVGSDIQRRYKSLSPFYPRLCQINRGYRCGNAATISFHIVAVKACESIWVVNTGAVDAGAGQSWMPAFGSHQNSAVELPSKAFRSFARLKTILKAGLLFEFLQQDWLGGVCSEEGTLVATPTKRLWLFEIVQIFSSTFARPSTLRQPGPICVDTSCTNTSITLLLKQSLTHSSANAKIAHAAVRFSGGAMERFRDPQRWTVDARDDTAREENLRLRSGVTALRSEVTALRSEVTTMRVRLEFVESILNSRELPNTRHVHRNTTTAAPEQPGTHDEKRAHPLNRSTDDDTAAGFTIDEAAPHCNTTTTTPKQPGTHDEKRAHPLDRSTDNDTPAGLAIEKTASRHNMTSADHEDTEMDDEKRAPPLDRTTNIDTQAGLTVEKTTSRHSMVSADHEDTDMDDEKRAPPLDRTTDDDTAAPEPNPRKHSIKFVYLDDEELCAIRIMRPKRRIPGVPT
ncbi:hypothetical protein HDK90DRAFT_463646 [Phyllosticta capitalensis]|uniref:Uncharacterized protein n=1 Tax=Phyllosticta capitalensis TaxID=121624 RepID=A0ABR1YUY0_9PEZI